MTPRSLFPTLLVVATSCSAVTQPRAEALVPPAPPPAPPPVEKVIVRPTESDEILVNPGMGIQTFQRFDGQALNPGLSWSEEGPVEPSLDPPHRPDFPGSSVAYCRWFWSTIEPSKGHYRWEIIDRALEAARAHHQTLAIRLMPYDPEHPLPAWYRSSGARRANKPTDKLWEPDFAEPLYEKHWGALAAAAGARYDGHPFLETVDIASLGYWGEGWSDFMPDQRTQRALVDIWVKPFTRTPLLMNFDEPEALTYGVGRGAGYRLDCLGDLRIGPHGERVWNHMQFRYPQQIVHAGVQDAWRRRPVSVESCWVPGYWKEHDFDVDAILAQALRWHVSSLNIKSSAIPPSYKAQFDAFQKKMGYRFVLRQLIHPRRVRAGQMMPVQMWWFNAGVAPVYRDYWLTLEIRSEQEASTLRVPVDVRTFLPDDSVFDGTLYVPETLTAGVHRLRVAMLDPRTGAPAVKLAIAGRQPDGWYDLGAIEVE